jgi:hypothetical protein
MAVNFSDLQLAFEFVSGGGMGENEAYLDRQSGKIYWHSEFGDNDEELPNDIDDEKYISIPDKRELDLVPTFCGFAPAPSARSPQGSALRPGHCRQQGRSDLSRPSYAQITRR